jgi:hypothetical protein
VGKWHYFITSLELTKEKTMIKKKKSRTGCGLGQLVEMFLRGIPPISLSNVIFNGNVREEDRGFFGEKVVV